MELLIDVQQASIKTLKAVTGLVIGELATVRLQKVACSRECLADSGEVGGGRGDGKRGYAVRLGCVVAGPVELALQIRLGDLQIAKRHSDVFVTHQLHESGQANAASEHFRGPGVTQAVRRDRARVGAACSLGEIGQRETQRLKQVKAAAHARQKEAFGFSQAGGRSQSAQLKNALQQPESFRIEGH